MGEEKKQQKQREQRQRREKRGGIGEGLAFKDWTLLGVKK